MPLPRAFQTVTGIHHLVDAAAERLIQNVDMPRHSTDPDLESRLRVALGCIFPHASR
jgi:hypothetical protein